MTSHIFASRLFPTDPAATFAAICKDGERAAQELGADDKANICPDCSRLEGEMHDPGCDQESCPFCAGQLITCGCGAQGPEARQERRAHA